MFKKIKLAAVMTAASMLLGGCTHLIVKNSDLEDTTPIATADKPMTETAAEPSYSSAVKKDEARSKAESKSAASKKEQDTSSGKKTDSRAESKAASKAESKPVSSAKQEPKADTNTTAASSKTQPPTISISLSEDVLYVGAGAVIYVTTTPESSWYTLTCSDASVATLNNDGTLTALKAGECTLTASVDGHSGVTASVSLKVVPAPSEEENSGENSGNGESNSENNSEYESVYINDILIVNKTYSIPASYDPGGLTEETQTAFAELVNAAAAEAGFSLYSLSDYRSYDEQDELYHQYIAMYGQAGADAICSKPGHSEHQTGMAIDVASAATSYFPGTAEASWLQNNCARFGFILRYPYGKEHITGYSYEAWHIRYVGDAAQDIMNSGLCLEEYLGVN